MFMKSKIFFDLFFEKTKKLANANFFYIRTRFTNQKSTPLHK